MRPLRISALLLLMGTLLSCSHLDDLGEPPGAASTSAGTTVVPRPTDAGRAAVSADAGFVSPPIVPSVPDAGGRFDFSTEGIAHDRQTGLYWQRYLAAPSSACTGVTKHTRSVTQGGAVTEDQTIVAAACTWQEADAFCKSARWDGYSTWRLPSESELRSILNLAFSAPNPRIDPSVFPNTPPSPFWTAEAPLGSTNIATSICFCSGLAETYALSTWLLTRCMRR